MEEVLLQHKDIAEAAVVAGVDELKGEIPIGFVVLKKDVQFSKNLEKELAFMIRDHIGPVASYRISIIV